MNMTDEEMTVIKVHMLSQSRPVVHSDVINSYTKDGMYCVLSGGGAVLKYPLCNIFRVTEDYPK